MLVFSGVVADKGDGGHAAARAGVRALIGALVAIGCGLAWGLINGFLVAQGEGTAADRHARHPGMASAWPRSSPAAWTCATVPTVMVNSVRLRQHRRADPVRWPIAAVVVVLGIVLLHRTRFGLHTYALGSNPEAGMAFRRQRPPSPGQ